MHGTGFARTTTMTEVEREKMIGRLHHWVVQLFANYTQIYTYNKNSIENFNTKLYELKQCRHLQL